MPSKPLRKCLEPSCRELVTAGRCPKCLERNEQRKAQASQHYDRYERDPKVTEFYKSPAWEVTRKVVLNRDHWLCQPCLQGGRITNANTVHHIEEVRDAWGKRFDLNNLTSVCPACHNSIHGRTEGHAAGQG